MLVMIGGAVASVAATALKMDMLLRGGVCQGALFHEGGVAFGPGLVQAYEIESRQAFYPRIVIDNAFAARLSESNFTYFCKRDADGSACIDYAVLMLSVGYAKGALAGGQEGARAAGEEWLKEIRGIVQRNLDDAQSIGDSRMQQNWQYFKTDVERAIEKQKPFLHVR